MEEKILEALQEFDRSMEPIEIYNKMKEMNLLDGEDSPEALSEVVSTLDKLQLEGKVYKTNKDKFILFEKCKNVYAGYLQVTKSGKIFFITPEGEEDIVIKPEAMVGKSGKKGQPPVFYANKDFVICERLEQKDGKFNLGRIIRLLDRKLDNEVGTIVVDRDNKFRFESDDKSSGLDIRLNPATLKNVVDGSKVIISIGENISGKTYVGNVIKVLGHKDDPGVDILSVAAEHHIYTDFPDEVLKEVDKIPEAVLPEELEGRKDLTDLLTFTIDGDHTKDFDDAVSLEFTENGNYKLYVHIADVSHYVKPDSYIDKEALKRGTSVYLADTVIPMLDHKLSNGICSLNEGEIRLTFTTEMEFDPEGNMINSDFYESYIVSQKRMTYSKVNEVLMKDEIPAGYEKYVNVLKDMNTLAKKLQKKLVKRGYIDFEIPEPKILQDEEGRAIKIVKVEHNDAERLIESFMIAANEAEAEYMNNLGLPYLYRVHGAPTEEKFSEFVDLVHLLGYQINTHFKLSAHHNQDDGKKELANISPRTVQSIINEFRDKPEFKAISQRLLRSMQKAKYSDINSHHFGLASRNYSHTTSPIRRYPDLQNQRLIKLYRNMNNEDYNRVIKNIASMLPAIAEQCSIREQDAVYAERDVDAMKSAEYMESHIGDEYEGYISGITPSGFFVELDNLVNGFVALSYLTDDRYYAIDELHIIGQNTGRMFKIGDTVRISVIAASKENSTVDFALVEERHGNTKQAC